LKIPVFSLEILLKRLWLPDLQVINAREGVLGLLRFAKNGY